jgi:hypothetical protein
MVTISINGTKSPREFQNMAQALAFAANNGDCRNAEKLEIAYASKAAVKPPAGNTGTPIAANTGSAGSNPPPVPGTTASKK